MASSAALVLVDVIHDLDYPGGEELLLPIWSMAQHAASLKRRARLRGIPAIYLNEEDDRFRPSFSRQVARCLREGVRGRPIADLLRPEKDDLFVLHSGQSASLPSRLDAILQTVRANTLILAGMAAPLYLLLTANDVYLSDFHLIVPSDCVAARSEGEKEIALEQLRRALDVDTSPSVELEPLLGLMSRACRLSDTMSEIRRSFSDIPIGR